MRLTLSETSASLSLVDFEGVLASSNIGHLALHGWGEPLLNAQLFQMVKYAESHGVSTELTTNATLLQTNMERIFTSGLSIIVFGIHDRENLPLVTPQIKELIARRDKEKLRKPKTAIDVVIYRGNQNQIEVLVEAAAQLNVDALVLHRVFNVWEANPATAYISIQEEQELFVKTKRLARELKLKLYLPPKPSIPCRAVKYSTFVTSEGKVTPCPYLPDFYVGDALNGGVRGAIYSQRYRNFVRNMEEHPICSRCPLGSINGNFYARSIG